LTKTLVGLAMQRPLLLRIDFTRQGSPLELPTAARRAVELCSIPSCSSLHTEIEAITPDILCFDYDFPDVSSLSSLRQIKKAFPSVPILMLTEHNSEELAVWALRSRVWDYFVKPLDADTFLSAIQQLHKLRRNANKDAARKLVTPASSKRSRGGDKSRTTSGPHGAKRAIARAKAYVAENLPEKISAKSVAALCNLSPFHFSRSFKRICGMTFSEYLMEARIMKAIELLQDPSASVTGVCFEVGFRDSSYFGRIFKRYAGITPSQYRDRRKKEASQAAGEGVKPVQNAITAPQPEDSTDALRGELIISQHRS
jgi:YesN/AraC family two-component response regulator